MPLPTLDELARAGGYAIAVFIALGVVVAFTTGKLHSDSELERERKRGDDERKAREAADAKVGDLTLAVREVSATSRDMAKSLAFIEDFYRDVLRDRLATSPQQDRGGS